MDNEQIILRATCAHLGIEIDEGASMAMLGMLPVFHTYQTWQELGYQVMRGQKAAFSAKIWKMTTKKDPEGEKQQRMIMKLSYFFGLDQCEKKAA